VLVPKLVTTLDGYDRPQFLADLTAGIIVGIVAIPLGIAFAIASGVPPERGLFTVVVAGFLISALGGSRVQIGGPTGAFVVIVFGIVQTHGYGGLVVATMMAGVILVGLGLAGLGGAIKFIPHSVITGFTSGIAVIIFSGVIRDLLGLDMGTLPAEFLERVAAYSAHVGEVSWPAVGVGAGSLLILLLWPRLPTRIPGPFVAIVAATLVVHFLHLPVDTIGSRFGAIQAGLPAPSIPAVAWRDVVRLVQPAITIALLGGIESLLSAVVADGMIGSRHRSNMELVAQGVANIVTPIFGGIPATGAIARTATNVRNGGRTPVAGVVHALVVLLIVLFLGRYAATIPMATLGAILAVVSYHMSEWRTFRSELRAPVGDVILLVTTFMLTVLVDLTVAVQVGIVLAAFIFMRRMSEVTDVTAFSQEFHDDEDPEAELARARGRALVVPEGVQVYDINGPFFFGAAASFKDAMAGTGPSPRVLIVRMRRVPTIDGTGINALRDLARRSRREGSAVLLSGLVLDVREALDRAGLLAELGPDAVFATYADSLDAARLLVGKPRG
jgi:SulP family sulfate permease